MFLHGSFALLAAPKTFCFKLCYAFINLLGIIVCKQGLYFLQFFFRFYPRKHLQQVKLCRVEYCSFSLKGILLRFHN